VKSGNMIGYSSLFHIPDGDIFRGWA